MKKENIKKKIEQNFAGNGWAIEEIRINPDAFTDDWTILIVSQNFEGISKQERKEKALAGLDDLQIEWLELLTPEEKKWAGSLPGDFEPSDLPLWPEALSQGAHFDPVKNPLAFLSDIDDDVEPPVITTFYSLRGGVGRSTALAYTAHILASQGKKVICVDMDLEAPGLTALFDKEKDIEKGMGLIHLLMAFDQGEKPDVANHLLRISEEYDLYCLPAGIMSADYARQLRFIDPESWYREEHNPLRELMDYLSNDLPFTPDVILLDARTGITQLSGPLLFDLSDISIIVFFPHPQAELGTKTLVRALLATKTRRIVNKKSFTPEIRFLVSPVPASKAPEVVRRYEHRAIDWISDWIAPWKNSATEHSDIVESDITHFIAYREVIAASDRVLPDDDIRRSFEQVSRWIERFLHSPGEKNIPLTPGREKLEILDNFSFSAGTAEEQDDLLDTFVETDIVKKALSPEKSLVIGRKGTGKTAIFRRLSENGNKDRHVFIITSPQPLSKKHPLYLSSDGFNDMEGILTKCQSGWREFWTIYMCLICYYSILESKGDASEPSLKKISKKLKRKPAKEREIVELIEKIMSISGFRLVVKEWLFELDKYSAPHTLLLFDGLDTGFGSTDRERERRKMALEGLFAFITENSSRLTNFELKILLREDIWKSLKFENKSHLFGRSVTLRWSDQISFSKVIIKQALRNESFKKILDEKITSRDIEHWAKEDVDVCWNVLVGERMKGSQTAFTMNWVWNRLADGNSDHSPRYLVQLMLLAVEWEKKEMKKTPYDRSIIRPRALTKVLPDVSGEALRALRDEEFPELKPLMATLSQIGRTPVDAPLLNEKFSADIINLAVEVGLLAVYESREEEVQRYMVPDIFRHALKMKRKGQA